MERHLNKSKYGCPANRFSGGGAGAVSMAEMSEGDLSNHSGHEIRCGEREMCGNLWQIFLLYVPSKYFPC